MSTHGPIDEAYRSKMNKLARYLDKYWNGNARRSERKVGFALLVFPFGEDPNGRINYIGNGDRRDIIVALKELVARFEGHDHVAPTTKQ